MIWTVTLYFHGAGEDEKSYPMNLYTIAFELYPIADVESSKMNNIFVRDIRIRDGGIISIHRWCLLNLCKRMKIDECRSRTPSRLSRGFFIDNPVLFMDRGAHCMRAALVNTMHALGLRSSEKSSGNRRRR